MDTIRHTSWVERAQQHPVAFAQVREDPQMDLELLATLGSHREIVMVASGGCTAAAIVAKEAASSLLLVDPNPAQIALTKIKLELLTHSPKQRLELLGHLKLPPHQRLKATTPIFQKLELPINSLGTPQHWAQVGLDHCGRYEALFSALRQAWGDEPLSLSPDARARAFAEVMSLPNLVALFGTGATANPREEFWQHFHTQTQRAIEADPALKGPFLSQLLHGRFSSQYYDWIRSPRPSHQAKLSWKTTEMTSALKSLEARSKDLVHLSNILDWLTPEEARQTLLEAYRVLRPGGLVSIRQLNSKLEISELPTPFQWQKSLGKHLLRNDRSFFYRDFLVGRRP